MSNIIARLVSFWHLISTKTTYYEYIVTNIEAARKPSGEVTTLIYFRAIGSRNIEFIKAIDLVKEERFFHFSPMDIQIVTTLSTIDQMNRCSREELFHKYNGYIEQCMTIKSKEEI